MNIFNKLSKGGDKIKTINFIKAIRRESEIKHFFGLPEDHDLSESSVGGKEFIKEVLKISGSIDSNGDKVITKKEFLKYCDNKLKKKR